MLSLADPEGREGVPVLEGRRFHLSRSPLPSKYHLRRLQITDLTNTAFSPDSGEGTDSQTARIA